MTAVTGGPQARRESKGNLVFFPRLPRREELGKELGEEFGGTLPFRPHFSLTPTLISGILKTLRGVAPGVCVCSPGLGLRMPLKGILQQQVTGRWA